jgi:hypothetical protein
MPQYNGREFVVVKRGAKNTRIEFVDNNDSLSVSNALLPQEIFEDKIVVKQEVSEVVTPPPVVEIPVVTPPPVVEIPVSEFKPSLKEVVSKKRSALRHLYFGR